MYHPQNFITFGLHLKAYYLYVDEMLTVYVINTHTYVCSMYFASL